MSPKRSMGTFSERRRLAEYHQKCEATLRGIFSAAPIGLGVVANGIIEQVNEKWCHMLGYTREELLEKSVAMLYPDAAAFDRVTTEMVDKLRQGDSGTLEAKWRCKDGRTVDVSISYAAVETKQNHVVAFTVQDISGQKQMEQERIRLETMLRQAQKMEAISTLAGGIAHDFNNILSPILIQTEMALLDLPPGSPIKNNLDDVLEAGNRARELVKQILTFSRQDKQDRQPILISSIVKESLKLIRATLPVTIAIEQRILAVSDMVLADSSQIHQVLMNLFTNAFQAMKEKGGVLQVDLEHLELDAEASAQVLNLTPGAYVKLTVIDNGIGMDRATMDRIFDPYFTSREKGRGTGMGLAVVHGIVKNYGGAISVKSGPGQGACFEVYLPSLEPEGVEKAGALAALPEGHERVLLVDDEESIVDTMQMMLERLGYQVEAKMSSLEAFETFSAAPHDFDLVISDQTMPGMTGEEFSKKLMALRPDVPIILCTGFSHVIDEEKAKAMGIRKLIMKPVVMREMALTIREILDECGVEKMTHTDVIGQTDEKGATGGMDADKQEKQADERHDRIATLCHSLNQPLMAISGLLEITLMPLSEDDFLKEKIQKILKQTEKMGRITREIMDISRKI